MFLPINGRDARRLKVNIIGNMTYQEAADLAGALKPGLVVPGHFDMFERNSENPQLFIDYMKVKYPQQKTLIPEHGRRVVARG
jgi:L-ascorbate metabolism protein UlaG (beta-lactamase superfamily)